MVLENVAVDHEKTIFQVSLHYDQPNMWINGQWNVTLSDEDGILYPLTDVTADTMNMGVTRIYQTIPFTGNEQLVLTLVPFPPSDTLTIVTDVSTDMTGFTFDPGLKPEVGKTWVLNQPLSHDDFKLNVINATLTDDQRIAFEVEPVSPVNGVSFSSSDPMVTGSSGGISFNGGNVTPELTFSGIPDHPIEIILRFIDYEIKGSWAIHWQPPSAPDATTNVPTQTITPPLVHLPTPTLAYSNPTLLEVQQLSQKFDSIFQQGSGWVHVIEETIMEPAAGRNLAFSYYKTEKWSEVDQDGCITQSVTLDYDDKGSIIQQVGQVGDYAVNFTSGFSGFGNGVSSQFSLDLLTRTLSGAIESGSDVVRKEVLCDDGRPCLMISILDKFDEPAKNSGETQALAGFGWYVWIDRATGQQVKWQRSDFFVPLRGCIPRMQCGRHTLDHTGDNIFIPSSR
jgi:hypothetical protein